MAKNQVGDVGATKWSILNGAVYDEESWREQRYLDACPLPHGLDSIASQIARKWAMIKADTILPL